MDRIIEFPVIRMGKGSSNAVGTIEVSEDLKILQDGEKLQAGERCMRILTAKDGDKRIVWHSGSLKEINAAHQQFNELVKQGLQPFRVGLDGRATSEEMTEFDAGAEEIIFLPMQAAVGG